MGEGSEGVVAARAWAEVCKETFQKLCEIMLRD